MFQKNTFAPSTSFGGFGSTGAATSPFGFKPTGAASAFGAAPTFGAAATTQQSTGTGLFGQSPSTGGLFGGATTSTAPAPAFGSTGASGFGGFGQTGAATGGGLFGANASGSGLFGQTQANSSFGAKPGGFGFGAAATPTAGTSLFGAGANTGGSLFGQQSTLTSGGGLFGQTTSAFGAQQPNAGTSLAKFSPVTGTDTVVKSGATSTVTTKHHCITCMKEYEGKCLEELRLEDYLAGRRGAAGGMFQPAADNKPAGGMFGQTSAFGQPTTTSSSGLFGTSTMGSGFGQANNSFSFGGGAQPGASTSLFGQTKPAFGATSTAGGGLFGATTQTAPAFGATGSTGFGFGSTAATPQANTGLFGAKPASGFGVAATTAASGFGAFGSNTSGGLFGAKTTTAASAFGTPAPAFGSLAGTGFGAATSTSGGLFGGGALGAKPAAPSFGFGAAQQQPTLGGGLGTLGGTSAFSQPKPAFPSFSTGTGFGLPTQTAAQPLTGFGGNTSLGGGGVSGFGSLGGSSLGGMGTLGGSALGGMTLGGTSMGGLTTGGGFGAAHAGNVHEQILSLATRPYGDSPLFKDLPTSTGLTAEDMLKPTNPAAVKAVLDKSNYRVSPSDAERLRVQPLAPCRHKKSLFDGLEESDASVEERLSLKPSRKRLVLRPQQNHSHDVANHTSALEDSAAAQTSVTSAAASVDAARRRVSFEEDVRGVNTDLEEDTEHRHSWMGSSLSGSPKGRPSLEAGPPSPRLYPDLEKEMPATSERRLSWLTTKPLQKAPPGGAANVSGAAESSVRELRAAAAIRPDVLRDDGGADTQAVSEEDNVSVVTEVSAHPAGVKMTRPDYYTIPSLQEMIAYVRPNGSCPVPSLTIGRHNYGSIRYDTEIDVAGMDFDKLVQLTNKEVCVYEDESTKPPVGCGLNRRATVTLERVWPRDKTARSLITDPEKLLKMDYESKLRRVCDKHNTKFVEYRAESGSWVFKVEHFSKYGLTDSDDEDDTPEIIKKQLQPPTSLASVKLIQHIQVGSGLAGEILPPGTSANTLAGATLSASSTLAVLSGAGLGLGGTGPVYSEHRLNQPSAVTGLAMDTSEENSMESTSLYPDTSSVFGVKSPTGELSRLDNRSSHRVQLMKASLYGDTLLQDMEDDVSVSTGDQLVPQPGSPRPSHLQRDDDAKMDDQTHAETGHEVTMPPLLVKPHTVVLRYHRRVPPFRHTIAGRLGAACLADMAVWRARHTRVGFGPGGRLALATTHDALTRLPLQGPLSKLEDYVAGRGPDDWSPQAVARLAVAGGDAAVTPRAFQEAMEPHLLAMLEHSEPLSTGMEITSQQEQELLPRLTVRSDPEARLALLTEHIARSVQTRKKQHESGVRWEYWRGVWTLCSALWGCELDARDAGALQRRRRLRDWLVDAVDASTQAQLLESANEEEPHAHRVLTLMLGGRLVGACRVARENGDLNMAAIIAQASGDATIRRTISRQLDAWRDCGALALVSRRRVLALALAAGRRAVDTPAGALDVCAGLDWLRALRVHHEYLCSQVATVEEAVGSFEACFRPRGSDEDADVELSSLAEAPPGLALPLPEYHAHYECSLETGGTRKRVLDLRYELLRARARGSRPDLQPATYTPDPLDYSLSFLLGSWLGGASVAATVGFAEQLEAAGAWHLAALVLAYHPSDSARATLVRGVISRHAPARDSADCTARLDFLRRIRVPQRWILLARAHRAKYEGLWSLEADHLAGAREWNAAHRVLLDKLLPDAVLADDLERLSPLLERLAEAAEREQVAGWESGGRALHQYLLVCNEIRGLVSSEDACEADRAALHTRLEALRPRVALACRSLGALAAPTPRHAAARTEMGARLLQLAVCSGAEHAQLARLLATLQLPPDCRHAALHKITMELAERASEACAADASPRTLARPLTATPQH